jgi:hypothetical protein
MKCNPFSTIAILFFFFFGTMILAIACLAQTAPQVQSSSPDQHATPADQRPTSSATSAGVPHRHHVRHNRVPASHQPAAATTSKSDKPAEKPSAPESDKKSDKKGDPESSVSAYGKWTLALALLALFVVAGIGWMIYLLLHLIAKVLEEMGKSAKDTHDVAVATKAQADSTRALAENALDQAKTSTLLAEQFKRSADASKASAESYVSMANSTAENLKFTQLNAHLEQRAWVSALMSLRRFKAGAPILADIVTSNSGKTPALHVDVTTEVLLAVPSSEPPRNGSTARQSQDEQARNLAPQAAMRITVGEKMEIAAEDFKKIDDGLLQYTLSGVIRYADIFGNCHETHFCGFIDPASKAIFNYKSGNEMT